MAAKRKRNEETPEKKKKGKREQTYIPKYIELETWPFIKPGKIDTYVTREICACEFSVGNLETPTISVNKWKLRLFRKIFVCP